MRRFSGTRFPLVIGLVGLAFYACKSESDDDPDGQAGASGTSTAGGSTGRGGSSSGHAGEGAAADSGQGGAGEGGIGEGGMSGSSGAPSGGSGGTTGGVAGEGAGGESGAGTGDGKNLGYLLGPEVDNQAPIVISSSRPTPSCVLSPQVVKILTDGNGNAYVGQGVIGSGADKTTKLGPDFTCEWTMTFDVGLVTPEGELFVAGPEARITKYDTDAEELWSSEWDSSGYDEVLAMELGSDGVLYVTGNSNGQAPGNPAEVAGGRWIARYEPDGTRTWLKQYADNRVFVDSLYSGRTMFLDASDRMYSLGTQPSMSIQGRRLDIFSADGALLDRLDNSLEEGLPQVGSLMNIVPAPDRSSFYSIVDHLAGVAPLFRIALINIDLEGNLRWYRTGEPSRSAVLDPVEGTTWHGLWAFNTFGPPYMLAADDAVYITGKYSNSYEFGSNPPPDNTAAFIGRYDLQGNRIWFKEFLIENGVGPQDPGRNAVMALESDGNLLVALGEARSDMPGGTLALQPLIFRLDAEDGTLQN